MHFLAYLQPSNHQGDMFTLVVSFVLLMSGAGLISFGLSQQTAPPPDPGAAMAATDTENSSKATPEQNSRNTSDSSGSEPRDNLSPSRPTQLRIPAINVNTEVTSIGKNPDGTIAVPDKGPDYNKAAWYKHSPTPGQSGPTMIEGHVDSAEQGASVFYRLGELKQDEKIFVRRADGKVVVYQIHEVGQYEKDDFPTDRVYGHTDNPTLRLVTCGGQYLQDIDQYESNTIVFARISDIRHKQ